MVSITKLRRSASELLAYALADLFPGVLLIGGRPTEFGFYYDVIAEQPIDDKAIDLIDEKLRGMIKQNIPVQMLEMMRENAAAFLEHKGQPFRAQTVLEARQNVVALFQLDKFYDYCALPYIQTTGEIEAIKVLEIEQIQVYLPEEGHVTAIRVRGTAFPSKDRLKKSLKSHAAAKKHDHRLLTKNMDIWAQYENASTLTNFWHPHGAELRHSLELLWRKEHRQQNFDFIISPLLVQESLLIKSGFFDSLTEATDTHACIFEGKKYCIPPTLAPLHALVFSSKLRSHSELPVRFAECAQLTAFDKNSELWGALDSKLSYSDRAYIFCTQAQLEKEVISSLQFIDKFIKIFGFEYHWCLEGQRPNAGAASSQWKKTEAAFVGAFASTGFEYSEEEGDGACYGPFAEAWLRDSVGREWQGPRLGVDLTCPARLGLRYLDHNGNECLPMMLERTLFRSFERFVAILIEHYAGVFPLWLAPEQVRVIPVSESCTAYAQDICKKIVEGGLRASVERSEGQLGSKVHRAENAKIPYMVIIGEKEEKQRSITVRSRSRMAVEKGMAIEEFLVQLQEEMLSKCQCPEKAERQVRR